MKRLLILITALFVLGNAFTTQAGAQATDWQQIKIPALKDFHPRQPKRIQLPNGMVIFLQEDHELPLIDGTIRIRGGSRSEPASKTGLLDIYGDAWRTGGTKTQTGDQLDDFLEIRAAKVETGSGADSTTISWSCLKEDNDDVFKVVLDLLQNPEFREDKIDIVRKQIFDSIARRNDDVEGIAIRESTKLAYGAKNPYTRDDEYATVAAVTRQDLLDWHKAHVTPNNMLVGIEGDFDSAALEARLRQAFGSWPKGPAVPQDNISFQPAKPGYYLIPKDDVNQSTIHLVALGIKRDNPDYYAIRVFNEAFGGGFGSRLFRQVRTNLGLAYSVGGGIGSTFDHPGILRLQTGTKSQSTVQAIQAIYGEIDRLAKAPIGNDELKQAKDSILNGFVFNFDSPDKVLREQMAYEFYGYPSDYLERFRAGIEKVTNTDVARVAAKYLHKDQLAVLVVGNTSEFDKPLSSLGTVSNVDITIPPMPGAEGAEPAEKPTASNAAGKALIAKVAAALGGEAKLKTIKSVRSDFSVTQKTPQGDLPMTMKGTIVYPDHLVANIEGPMGNITMVATPQAAFMAAQGRSQDMPSGQKTEMLTQIKRDIIYVGQHASDPAFIFAANGSEKIGSVDAQILDISGEGMTMRWFIDPQNGKILRETYPTVNQSGPAQGETELEDWQTTDGVTLPRLRKNKQNGEASSTVEITKTEFNPAVDAKVFDKPVEKPQ
jgi:zinc protease